MTEFTTPVVTIEGHILEEQKEHPEASGVLTNLLYDIALAGKIIHREVNRAGLADILGGAGTTNVSGDDVKKLDIYADRVMYRTMHHTGRLCAMASEEQEEIITIPEQYPSGMYVLLFDPLDGSSNIEANAPIGTIFSVQKKVSPGDRGSAEDCLQPGSRQVAAGYILYGSSTILVYTTGQEVNGFTLDPTLGEFLLSHPNIRMPATGKVYSVNEQSYHQWDPNQRAYVDWVKGDDAETRRPRSTRYIGSLVGDFHRNLMYGGIFMYPGTKNRPEGKLRLLYEASPLAFVAEVAGGKATTGTGTRILDVEPTDLHQRTPLFVGSADDVDEVESFLKGTHPAVS